MMRKKNTILCGLILVCWICNLNADDLTLKNGRVLKNYRIKEIKNNRATVVFTQNDGSPDVVYVAVDDLPDALKMQYDNAKAIPVQPNIRKAKTLRGELINTAEQLQYDLSRLPADNKNQRTALLNRVRYQVVAKIASLAETADFQVLATDKSGAVVRVVGTYKNARLSSGQLLYLYGYKAVYRTFQQKIYPSGISLNYGDYGVIGIYSVNADAAGQVALSFISRYLGDNTLFLSPTPEPAVESQPVMPSVINNIYYVQNDDDDWDWVDRYYISRPARPPHRPDHRPQPDKPGRPGKPDTTGKPENKPDKPEKKPWKPSSPSIISKTEGSTISRGLLPDWDNPRIKYAPKSGDSKEK